jgi:hypothetical protein
MGGKHCAVHENQPSVSSCKQCGKDLCKSCVMVTPAGTFCSSECSVLHRELKSQGGPAKRTSGGGAMKFVLFLLLLAAAAFAIHLAPMTTGKPYDVIGRFLNKTPAP